jgi:hypothetical protein
MGELRPVRLALLASIKVLLDKAPVLPALQERFQDYQARLLAPNAPEASIRRRRPSAQHAQPVRLMARMVCKTKTRAPLVRRVPSRPPQGKPSAAHAGPASSLMLELLHASFAQLGNIPPALISASHVLPAPTPEGEPPPAPPALLGHSAVPGLPLARTVPLESMPAALAPTRVPLVLRAATRTTRARPLASPAQRASTPTWKRRLAAPIALLGKPRP